MTKAKNQSQVHEEFDALDTAAEADLGIESGVPIPTIFREGKRSVYRNRFEKMKVGDSFPVYRPAGTPNISDVMQAAKKACPGTKWTTRKIRDGEFRIWRVEAED